VTTERFARRIGWALIVFGLAGLVPFSLGTGRLAGLFAADPLKQGLHLLGGTLALVALSRGWARPYYQFLGSVYLLLAILGLGAVDAAGRLFGTMRLTLADSLAHLAIGAVSAFVGFERRDYEGARASHPRPHA
jgi:hypothetical protein